jgi:hypothetical protein
VHRANVTIFLTAIGLIGIAPVILLLVAVLRRRRDVRVPDVSPAAGRSTLIGVAILTAALVLLGGSTAWILSARGVAEGPSMAGMAEGDGAEGMPMSGGDDGSGPSLPALRTLGGLPLTSSVTGPDAVEQVAALHGSGFPVRDAFIGTYGGGRATIWVSEAPDRRAASEQVRMMVAAIVGSGSPFVDPRPVKGRSGVFETTGMGQRHYFFARGVTVWWVASDPQLSNAVLDDVLGAAR